MPSWPLLPTQALWRQLPKSCTRYPAFHHSTFHSLSAPCALPCVCQASSACRMSQYQGACRGLHGAAAQCLLWDHGRALNTSALQVTQSAVYRTAANRLYPVISTYADPALDKITHSPYYQAAVDHLRPHPSCAASAAPKEGLLEEPKPYAALPCVQC